MAYDRAARAAKEAAFRRTHGMSSGTWYEMRRKAAKAGISPSNFDKAKGNPRTYRAIKGAVQAKRQAHKARQKGQTTSGMRFRIQDMIDQLPPEIEITWGTP